MSVEEYEQSVKLGSSDFKVLIQKQRHHRFFFRESAAVESLGNAELVGGSVSGKLSGRCMATGEDQT